MTWCLRMWAGAVEGRMKSFEEAVICESDALSGRIPATVMGMRKQWQARGCDCDRDFGEVGREVKRRRQRLVGQTPLGNDARTKCPKPFLPPRVRALGRLLRATIKTIQPLSRSALKQSRYTVKPPRESQRSLKHSVALLESSKVA
jgi:hypothetical protein